jgi:light-independent protochlorophyllide reductase subunit B
MMGLEEHLLHMFRDDFEFNDTAQPSHLAPAAPVAGQDGSVLHAPTRIEVPSATRWADEASGS